MLAKIEKFEPMGSTHESRSDSVKLVRKITHLTQRLEEMLEDPERATASEEQWELLNRARMWLNKQNSRSRYLPKNVVREPAWNILLDLYVQEKEERTVSITSACVASGGAPTTALRWITVLEESGLISRIADAKDGRRNFIRLTPKARSAIENWLSDSR